MSAHVQAISSAEGEATRKKVQAQASRKQSDKLRKDIDKTEKERGKAQAELERLDADNQVRLERDALQRLDRKMFR